MSEERPRWWMSIVLVVIALGGLGWAIVRYANFQPEAPPDNNAEPLDANSKGPPVAPQLPPIPKGKGPGKAPSPPKD